MILSKTSPSSHVSCIKFHGCDEVFISGVMVGSTGSNISIFIFGQTAESVHILDEDFADDDPLAGRR
jgi:hypothetical protein